MTKVITNDSEIKALKCFHGCNDAIVGVYYFPDGCVCNEATLQALCLWHMLRASSNIQHGDMIDLITLNRYMKPQSAKAKGRNLQKYVVSRIRDEFEELSEDDVISRSMGAGGEDIILSKAARNLLPLSIECKNKARISLYKDYEQAKANAKSYEPVLIVKQNHSKPLVILDLDYFLYLFTPLHTKDYSVPNV